MLKTVAKGLLTRLGYELHRKPAHEQALPPEVKGDLENNPNNWPVPWTLGYFKHRDRVISENLNNPSLMDRFSAAQDLPGGYGIGVDERCVEYPWLLTRLEPGAERLLDAGSALNHDFILDHSQLRDKKIHILTLVPEQSCYWYKGVSYLYDDLRALPIRDSHYDTIACISTLEHVGFDNSVFAKDYGNVDVRPDDFLVAIREMRRVLKPGGKLCITVPYGLYVNLGTCQIFNARLVERALAAFEPSQVEQTYFRYTATGWGCSTANECDEAEYVSWVMLPAAHRPDRFPEQPDRATAARAVACFTLIKPQ